MRVVNIFAAGIAALLGALGLAFGLLEKDATVAGFGLALLISALIFGTFSNALLLLEAIRDGLKKP